MGTAFDVTERKRAEAQITSLAYHDTLTGLPNRLLFADRLTLAVAQAHRRARRLGVLFLDVDRFKVINDSLGHSVGDRLLKALARRVAGTVRDEDTVARLGGDEFILLLPDASTAEDVVNVAEKILEAVRKPVRIDESELFVTASIGISLYPDDGTDPETLVKNADTAMYRAKEQGRDNVSVYAAGDERQRAGTPRDGERLPQGDRSRRARRLLPADPGPFERPGARRRGAAALETPRSGDRLPTRFHPDGRGDRADPLDRPLAVQDGLRPGSALAKAAPPGAAPRRQPLRPPVPAARPRRAGARGREADGLPVVLPRSRDHRELRDAERGRHHPHAARAEGARRGDLDRRLRHRLFVAQLPEALPDRHAQDRPLLRPRHRGAIPTTRRS